MSLAASDDVVYESTVYVTPPGTKVLVHEKPADRTSWDSDVVELWYTGPMMHHYRWYQVWVWQTKAERIADTLA